MADEPILIATDVACIKVLADLFGKNQRSWRFAIGQYEALGLTEENAESTLATMERLGIIEVTLQTNGRQFGAFNITTEAVLWDRKNQAKAKEGKDLVESLKLTLRKHPLSAWVMVVFIVILTTATAITQIGGALKMLRIID